MSFRRSIFPMTCSSKQKGASACSDSVPGQLVSEIPEQHMLRHVTEAQVIPWSSLDQGAHKQFRMQHHCSGGHSLGRGAGSKASELPCTSFPLLAARVTTKLTFYICIQRLQEILCKLKYCHLFNTAFRGEITVI